MANGMFADVLYIKDNSNATPVGGGGVGWSTLAQWTASTAYTVGQIVRQRSNMTVLYEQAFVCVVAGTSSAAEPAWSSAAVRSTYTDGGVTWRAVGGHPAVCGDITNTPVWLPSSALKSAGCIVKNTAGTHLFCLTTSLGNTSAGEPSWNTTLGATTADTSNVWTCIGTVAAFSAWQAPVPRLGGYAAQDTYALTHYVSHQHLESRASSVQLASTAYTRVVCVNDGAAPPTTAATTGQVSCTGGVTMYFNGCYVYGMKFVLQGGSVAPYAFPRFDNCTFDGYNSATYPLSGGGYSYNAPEARAVFNNCLFKNYVTGLMSTIMDADFNGCNFTFSGTAPTTLVSTTSTAYSESTKVVFRGCDVSAFQYICDNDVSGTKVSLYGCKLRAVWDYYSSTPAAKTSSPKVFLQSCDNSTLYYRAGVADYAGRVDVETTVVKSGGASDGVTPISWKIQTYTGVPNFVIPFTVDEEMNFAVWNSTVGSAVTVTVDVAGAVQLTDGDIWMEVEYLGSAASPQTSIATTAKASLLASNTNLASSAASWATSPTYRQKLVATVTPQMAGAIKINLFVAKDNALIYVDPKIVLS